MLSCEPLCCGGNTKRLRSQIVQPPPLRETERITRAEFFGTLNIGHFFQTPEAVRRASAFLDLPEPRKERRQRRFDCDDSLQEWCLSVGQGRWDLLQMVCSNGCCAASLIASCCSSPRLLCMTHTACSSACGCSAQLLRPTMYARVHFYSTDTLG